MIIVINIFGIVLGKKFIVIRIIIFIIKIICFELVIKVIEGEVNFFINL